MALDRAVNLGLLSLGVVSIYRLAGLARSRVLWSVSRKLVLSYVLVGAVPILLLLTFAVLAIVLVFLQFSSYLVQDRAARLTDQADVFARTTVFELEREGVEQHAEVAERRQSAIAVRYPGATVVVSPAADLPRWVPRDGFSGLVEKGQVARSVIIAPSRGAAYAVTVDLPVQAGADQSALAAAGIRLGPNRAGSLLNTATFLQHVDWKSGAVERTPVAMGVDIGQLYDWLAAPHERRLDTANDLSARSISFNQLLWYVAVGIGVLLFVIEVIALTNGLALARTITSSVDQLFMGTERVKSGDFTARVAVQSDDQLGQLAGSFNDMTGRIEGLLREQDEKRRLEEELRIARQMQMSLLPGGILNAPGVSVAALCAPAREVGGDYYDFLRLPDGRIGLLIADVSGKGTSAAFYMAELKGLMLSLSRTHTSPRALLIEANRIIAEHLDSRSFITATYAVLDPAARFLTCARAGHAPFVRVFGQPGPSQPAEVLAPDGMVLGLNLDGGERFERCLAEVVIPLASGDLFCFYTDGVSEAMDGTGDCFGEQRLTDFLLAHSNLPPPLIRDRLLDELRAFACGQPQHDDITMIVMKIGEPLGDGRAGDRDGRHG